MMKMSTLLCASIATLALGAIAPGPVANAAQSPPTNSADLRVQAYSVERFPSLAGIVEEGFRLSVTLGGQPRTIQAAPYSVRSPDFRVMVQGPGGELAEHPAPPVTTYRGWVVGEPGSTVVARVFEGRITAVIDRGELGHWNIQPSDELIPGAAREDHMIFRSSDVLPSGKRCGVEDDAPIFGEPGGGLTTGTGDRLVEIAADADFEFYQKNGSSVTATVSDVESVINGVETIYERDIDVTFEVTTIVVRSDSGSNPYSSNDAETLLCQFRTKWNAAPELNIQRDVAHLFTGRTLSGTTIGLAWLGVVCNQAGSACPGTFANLAYSIVESRYFGATAQDRQALSAHEIGHNHGGSHCDSQGADCHIMCSVSGGCGGDDGANLKFGVSEQSEIESFVNGLGCVAELPSPQPFPFDDSFPSTTFDGTKWTWRYTSATDISPNGSNEPSAPNAMRLRSFGSAQFRDGEVRSNFIQLQGQSSLVLDFHLQRVGVESGESLTVEYNAAFGGWQPLLVVVSDGVSQTEFDHHTIPLPALAYHNEFRVRFKVEGNEFNDEWYVDDVHVGLPIIDPCPEDIDSSGSVDFNDLLVMLAAWGACPGCPADLDFNGSVDFNDLLLILAAWGPC